MLERLTAFLALGVATRLAAPRWRSVFLVLVAAISLELLQHLVPHRDPRLIDATLKIFGGITGIILAECLVGWWRNLHLMPPRACSTSPVHKANEPVKVATLKNDGFEMASLVPSNLEDVGADVTDTEPR